MLYVSGVSSRRFSLTVGLPWRTILYYANREYVYTSSDAAILVYDNMMTLLNERLGEIMGVRIELEEREAASRTKRIVEHARQGATGVRPKPGPKTRRRH